ncbi:MAG: dTDP-4-dehydrorhamnose 3,5-epimerase family protein [Burkholderiaceae bacterium]
MIDFEPTAIPGAWLVRSRRMRDDRGSFARLYCRDAFASIRPGLEFVQVNHSVTRLRGTVRGMHFQHAPAAEVKLVRCIAGAVHDVVVDVRAGSPGFLRTFAVRLSADEDVALLIPEGVAHGFQALADGAALLYQHGAPYTPACEDGVRHDDPALGIAWPLPVAFVSERDRAFELVSGRTRPLWP